MLDDIYNGFQRMMRSNEPVRFTNTFHSMPVSYSGRVLSLEGGQVTLNVPRIQIICIRQTRITYIRSNLLPFTLRAHAVMWNLRDEMITLERFERSSDTIGSRSLVRVEPRQNIQGIIVANEDKVTHDVSITEMSLRGLTGTVATDSYNEKDFGKGERVFLVFPLPAANPTAQTQPDIVSCKGIIRNVFDTSSSGYRLGIQIFPTAINEQFMTRYIALRQSELLKDLRKLSTEDLLI